MSGGPGDALSRRCVTLVKKAVGPDFWPGAELKLAWFEKLLMTVEGQTPNFNNICTTLEMLIFFIGILVSDVSPVRGVVWLIL